MWISLHMPSWSLSEKLYEFSTVILYFRASLVTLATSCKELTHWKRLWCWEGVGAGGEGDDRGWDGWMASASQTRWTWVWVNSGSWWWTGRPGMLQFMGSQRVGHDWATELNWTSTSIKRKLSITLKKNFTATLSVERSHPNPECSVYLHQFKVSIQYQGQHTLPL